MRAQNSFPAAMVNALKQGEPPISDAAGTSFSGIYMIWCAPLERAYIGQSNSVHSRWNRHLRELSGERHSNEPLQYAFLKYGAQSLLWIILEKVAPAQLNQREAHWIREHRSADRRFGFNLSNGGNSEPFLEATCAQMSVSALKKWDKRYEKEPKYSYAGQKFGEWTALYQIPRAPGTKSKHRYWQCRCRCGHEAPQAIANLKSGNSFRCRECSKKVKGDALQGHDLTGRVFGRWTVLERTKRPTPGRGRWWLCQCVCGSTSIIQSYNLTSGKSTQCVSCGHRALKGTKRKH